MKYVLLIALILLGLTLPRTTFAQTCATDQDCNGTDVCGPVGVCIPAGGGPGGGGNNPFGTVDNPLGYGDAFGGGLIILFNNILRLVFAGAGVFAFIKILMAGFGFLNAGGDPKKIESAWASIWQTIIGLAIIISAFAIAAIIGQIFFGSATAILNPRIYRPN